jgi:Fis family transcriptional regulator, factor for inversion stimulation protein
MKKEDLTAYQAPNAGASATNASRLVTDSQTCSLRQAVERAMESYLSDLGDEDLVNDLYELVLSEVEAPLLEAVLRHTSSNQSRASTLLGLNRGTLRKKMKQYGLL